MAALRNGNSPSNVAHRTTRVLHRVGERSSDRGGLPARVAMLCSVVLAMSSSRRHSDKAQV
jgi:hypothetical protein